MPHDIPLKCRCGAITGQILAADPARANRLICMCDDCQAYGRWLPSAPSILDANGGTEIFQMTPAQLRIHAGHEQIRCLQLRAGGLMRWHSGCCRTPIANTLATPRMPFLGLPCAFIDLADDQRERLLGPIIARIHARYGKPPLPAGSHPRAPAGLLLRFTGQIARGFFTGAHKPNALRRADGTPIVEPTVLTAEERAPLYAAG